MPSVPGGAHWGGGLFISSEDHARVGLLIAREGDWDGRRVLDADGVREMLRPCPINAEYGCLWWLNTGGTALDLSAIAKGFAVDRVHAALVSQAPDVLVEIGGEVRASGDGPRGGWTLGVDRPVVGSAPGTDLVAMVPLNNQAMATSGNYRNAYEVDGQTVVHTLDPRLGRPVQTDVLSVTVVAEDCMTADAWATALMVLPLNEGQPLVASMPGVEALWFVSSPTGLTSVSTDGVAWVIRGDSAPDGIH